VADLALSGEVRGFNLLGQFDQLLTGLLIWFLVQIFFDHFVLVQESLVVLLLLSCKKHI
jgi:hypothetical protein